MKSLSLIALTAALFTVATSALAQTPAASSTLAPKLAEADKKFIKDFAEQHNFEQELANKARGKEMGATRDKKPNPLTPAATTLYKKVLGDLTTSWTEFATLSQAKKVDILASAKPKDAAEAAAMGKLAGDKFDKEFVKMLGKEAKKTDLMLTNAGKTVRDPEVKAFVDKWAPAFKGHLAEVETAEKALKGK